MMPFCLESARSLGAVPFHRNHHTEIKKYKEHPRAMTAVVSTYSYSLDYGHGALKIQNACRPARNVQATNFQNLDGPEVRRSSKLRPARESKCIAAAIDSIDNMRSLSAAIGALSLHFTTLNALDALLGLKPQIHGLRCRKEPCKVRDHRCRQKVEPPETLPTVQLENMG